MILPHLQGGGVVREEPEVRRIGIKGDAEARPYVIEALHQLRLHVPRVGPDDPRVDVAADDGSQLFVQGGGKAAELFESLVERCAGGVVDALKECLGVVEGVDRREVVHRLQGHGDARHPVEHVVDDQGPAARGDPFEIVGILQVPGFGGGDAVGLQPDVGGQSTAGLEVAQPRGGEIGDLAPLAVPQDDEVADPFRVTEVDLLQQFARDEAKPHEAAEVHPGAAVGGKFVAEGERIRKPDAAGGWHHVTVKGGREAHGSRIDDGTPDGDHGHAIAGEPDVEPVFERRYRRAEDPCDIHGFGGLKAAQVGRIVGAFHHRKQPCEFGFVVTGLQGLMEILFTCRACSKQGHQQQRKVQGFHGGLFSCKYTPNRKRCCS